MKVIVGMHLLRDGKREGEKEFIAPFVPSLVQQICWDLWDIPGMQENKDKWGNGA